jgi:hypothetical protein
MTEPTYEYIRGQGWVPCIYKMRQGQFGKWLVTAMERKPVLGELYFINVMADGLFDELTDEWWHRRLIRTDWDPAYDICKIDNSAYSTGLLKNNSYGWLTVYFELIND